MKRTDPDCGTPVPEGRAIVDVCFEGTQALTNLRRVADGHAQQRLVEQIIPAALQKADADEYAQSPRVVGDLADLLHRHTARFAADLEHLSWNSELAIDWTNLARELDDAFAAYVSLLGKKGAKWAQRIRRDTTTRIGPDLWRLWRSDVAGEAYLIGLARVLWEENILPTVRRVERNPPALAAPVYDTLARLHSRAYEVKSSVDDQGALMSVRLIDRERRDEIDLVPSVTEETIRLVGAGAELLKSVTAQKVLRWEVTAGTERRLRGVPDARVLVVDGGWSVFASQLGLTKKQHAEDLRAILHAQAAVTIRQADGSRGTMLALREVPQNGRHRGRIEITLGTMLMPYYVFELPRGEARRLVPLPQLPPFVGRSNEHAAQATASMLLVRELRARAVELYREHAALIPDERLAMLFGEARVPAQLIPRVMGRWTRDGDDGPAFLIRCDADRYTLGDAHALAREFLREAGRKEAQGSEAGKASAKKRAARLQRLAS